MSDIAALVAEIDALAAKATKGPWEATCEELNEPASPDVWAIHAADKSLEATVAQCWSGEHNNQAHAELIVALVNAWSRLREMAEDAERYRWLRGAETWQPCFAEKGFNGKNGWLYRAGSRWTGRNLDSAIDAAIDAARKEAGRG